MKMLRLAAALAVVIGLSACGGSDDSATEVLMPDVVGARLDAALSDIEGAGFKGEVDVSRGGTFGIVDESNWQVCEQSPPAGKALAGAPKLTVDRTCGGDDADESTTTTLFEGESSRGDILTADGNVDLAVLLAEPDDCGITVEAFAATYRGRTIEFDGSVAAFANHSERDTRYDILVRTGDVTGPNFQFRDVGIADLKLTGSNIPATVGQGDSLHVVAKLEEYDADQCLLFLDPVSTEVR